MRSNKKRKRRGFGFPRKKKAGNRLWCALVEFRPSTPGTARRPPEARYDPGSGQPKARKACFDEATLGDHFGQHRRSARPYQRASRRGTKRRRERAQQEILHRRFGRPERIAAVSRQKVAGDRTHLQADERRCATLRRSKHANARRGKPQQRVKFREKGKAVPLQVWPHASTREEKRHRDHERRKKKKKTKGKSDCKHAEDRPALIAARSEVRCPASVPIVARKET